MFTAKLSTLVAAVALAGVSGGISAQVVINEVFENPPNGGDERWEYIELYGPPNYDLTGYAVLLIKGQGEIDECFSLDGWSTADDGIFVLYQVEGTFQNTGLGDLLGGELPGFSIFNGGESPTNQRFEGAASFATTHIPPVFSPGELSGKLENEGSSSYLLVRRRPFHALSPQGTSRYLPGYAWSKDTDVDVDGNSRLDFGDETPVDIVGDTAQEGAAQLEPVQIIDELAWSNDSQKEYNTPGRGLLSGELSETPGFNPDAASRVRYLGGNVPAFGGSTIGNSLEATPRNVADESWIYGETMNVTPGSAEYTLYRNGPFDGPRTAEADELVWLAPTDPSGPMYSYDGPGDDNPLEAPFFEFSGALDPNGTLLFEPYDINGFRWTPGSYNDAPAQTALVGTDIERQFRWSDFTGDFNFDGIVDCTDWRLIERAMHAGYRLDDAATLVRDFNDEDSSNDITYQGFRWQHEGYNALLAMIRMETADGSSGDWTTGQVFDDGDITAWGGRVTPSDLAAFESMSLLDGTCFCAADVTLNNAPLDFLQTLALLRLAEAGDLAADVDRDGDIDGDDVASHSSELVDQCSN